jgi:hypothetical protein
MHDRPSNAADQATDKAQLKPRAVAAGAAAAPISLKARRKVSGRGAWHAVLDFEQLLLSAVSCLAVSKNACCNGLPTG